jgi:hypothetical protein
VYVRNQRQTPLKSCTGSNLVDMGRGAVHVRPRGRATSLSFRSEGSGGHEEGLRRTRGEAAGAELGTDPVDRDMVNVGSTRIGSRLLDCRFSSGQARRPPVWFGCDGAVVVLGAGESPAHGEGRQRGRGGIADRAGGRR